MLDELHRVLADFERRVGEERRYGAQVYSFPQVWASTALGFGGAGGRAITTAQTYVIVADYGPTFVYFGGRFAYETDARQAMEWVRALRCPDVRTFRLSAQKTQEGEYARNQQEAVEHIRTLPPSERSAVANRPGQAPPSTPERQTDAPAQSSEREA